MPVTIEFMRTSLQNDIPPGASRDAQWKNSGFTIYEKARGPEEDKYVKDHKQGLNQGEAYSGPLFLKPWKHVSPHALQHSIGVCSIYHTSRLPCERAGSAMDSQVAL
jgi:hypothetical protein